MAVGERPSQELVGSPNRFLGRAEYRPLNPAIGLLRGLLTRQIQDPSVANSRIDCDSCQVEPTLRFVENLAIGGSHDLVGADENGIGIRNEFGIPSPAACVAYFS